VAITSEDEKNFFLDGPFIALLTAVSLFIFRCLAASVYVTILIATGSVNPLHNHIWSALILPRNDRLVKLRKTVITNIIIGLKWFLWVSDCSWEFNFTLKVTNFSESDKFAFLSKYCF
jgi:hypothetical protein